jgi:mannose-6-phosphate isomerase-like protein (cupin superfamily)
MMLLRNRERDAAPFVTKDGSTIREYHHTELQSLAEASLEAGTATERHYHARSEEIYLLVAGGGELEVDGARRPVGPGDAILIPPGAWHQLHAGEEGARLLCCCVPPYSDDDTFFA